MRNRFRPARIASGLPGLIAVVLAQACASVPPHRSGDAPPAAGPEPSATGEALAGAMAGASFTDRQADRGQTEFSQICGECHSTSEFRGETFQYEWRRRTAWDFYELVSETMPENAPGSLTDDQYVDVIAYVLRMNGFTPGGRELPATRQALDQFVMNAPRQ